MLAAAAAPVAPNRGISTKSSATPTTSDTRGPSEDSPGDVEATSAFEKTAVAAKPSAPGSSQRKGSTDGRNAVPKTTGRSSGPEARGNDDGAGGDESR